MSTKITICITTYNRVSYLERLLKSISDQTFTDYDIMITDNSETTIVKDFVATYKDKLPITYHKNVPAVGMAENWNICMGLAKGEWIKLIHDDDWLASPKALEEFYAATKNGTRFIYSARYDFYEHNGKYVQKSISNYHFSKILKNPYLLIADNYLGPPSVLMFHKSVTEYYDTKLTWYVDIEFYIRMLLKEGATYVTTPLINMSYNPSQMTNSCLKNPNIMIPEFFYILEKFNIKKPNHILIYDYWWRLFRNLNINKEKEIYMYYPNAIIPLSISKILHDESKIPPYILSKGILSKLFMFISFIKNNL